MIVFDDHLSDAFHPITLTRSVSDIRCGILKLRQRLQNVFGDEDQAVWIDHSLLEVYLHRHPDWQVNQASESDSLLVNSRLIPCEKAYAEIKTLQPQQALIREDSIVAFRTSGIFAQLPTIEELQERGVRCSECDLDLYQNLAQIILDNPRLIKEDFELFFYDKDNSFETEPGVIVLNPYNVWIGENVSLKPGVVLDASDGPIVIDEDACVMSNAVIMGPCYIGKKSLIKIGAKIYGGTSIGAVCKVGGEVECSIFQAFSNKQHDGFLGHAFVGEWVNIGADTNNSDLKNTYKNVAFHSYRENCMIDSGSMFLGSIIADHVKLGINCSINTGCVIGIGANLYGANLISGFIPDFSWGEAGNLVSYRFDAICDTAKLVKQRRGLELSSPEIKLLKHISENT
ncbi:MAG: putative sugar nucleotidyl transferase [Candidatus Cloacimonadaceae bacterium]|nr:putative sugar nucleotidyl transferase [Candidatus Cloacimonadaceae bacterium]